MKGETPVFASCIYSYNERGMPGKGYARASWLFELEQDGERVKTVKDKVVVITGASAGVGRAAARLFAQKGARVALIARGEVGLAGAREDVERLGAQALVLPLDVADAPAVEQAAQRIENELGPIEIWVNNAMVSVFSPIKEMTPDEFKRVTEVNYLGYVYGTLAALKYMLPRDRGVVVQVGSALAYRGIPLQSAYCASKHAIQGFTESLRTELEHDHSSVWVSMVQMPALNTPQFNWVKSRLPRKPQPVPPIFQPEVAARAIYYAATHHRRELWVGYPTVKTVWGNRFLPGYVDRELVEMGYDSQQYDGKVSPDRQNNLWSPVPIDYGAHGDFDARAREHSPQLWLNTHRKAVLGAAAALLGLSAGLWGFTRRS